MSRAKAGRESGGTEAATIDTINNLSKSGCKRLSMTISVEPIKLVMIEPTAKHVHRSRSDTVHCVLGECLAIAWSEV